jgi:Fe-S cluster assembly ATP-binding protein
MLEIDELNAYIEDKHILKNFALSVQKGQVHAIMGPNGAGKSTLAKVLAGHPSYEVSGSVTFKGQDILEMEPEVRSHQGLFMSFQYPVEIPGILTKHFLYEAYQSHLKANGESAIEKKDFEKLLIEKSKELEIPDKFLDRGINDGFSGGEKKRSEILQMSLLKPCIAILDETDSGLDIDAMKIVAKGVNRFRSKDNALILITHYQRLLDYIVPDFVHVMIDGKIVHSAGVELAKELEIKGYDWLIEKGNE